MGLAAVIAATAALLRTPQSPAETGTVTALVELARVGPPAPLPEGGEAGAQPRAHFVELSGRRLSLIRYRVDGREVLIAASDEPFTMPGDARPVSRERGAPWLASRGDMSLACLSRPTHRLLVGALPPERLLEVGQRLAHG